MKYGLIPELVGRIPVLTTLTDLDEPALVRILTEPKNALLKQYQRLFQLDGIHLIFEEEALEAVAKLAIQRKTGARGLRSIMEATLGRWMYEAPADATIEQIVITAACVDGKGEPVISRDPSRTPVRRSCPPAEELLPGR